VSNALRGLRIGFVERPHAPGHRGSVTYRLIPLLQNRGARIELVHAENNLHRLDTAPPWDLVVLKSGSAAALHLAATAEAWRIPSVNRSGATRLAQDKLASAAILQRAGLPIAPAHLAWLGSGIDPSTASVRPRSMGDGDSPVLTCRAPESSQLLMEQISGLPDCPLIVKAARGSRGTGLWGVEPGELPALAATLPGGPYLLMERVPHAGDDLKVFVAGEWMAATERSFPAASYADKLGRPVPLPSSVAEVAREAGRLLGLACFGCDFVKGPGGWTLVDVNAFPGYKGAIGAPEALAVEISRFASEGAIQR
jgi:ribosomal protein S6--L-glutamate ligase